MQNPELLAPAGGLESFFAAMEAGADAVYCGLTDFSARAKAKNFSLAEVEEMTAYAHDLGRKLYVTINTLIKEEELPGLIDLLAGLAAIGIDAVIIQDMGVWRLIRNFFPELVLHASTQMTVHNSAGVKMLERLGFSRAVLARELSLAEIDAIRSKTSLELEIFVHGALCFCISGQCYFSSFLVGHSGNRGRCMQPCRRRYAYQGLSGYYFSTSDLCAIELLPRLREIGIKSVKLEGRMKSAEYVARVVAAYRMVMNAPPADFKNALKEARTILEQSYGRQSTKGFFAGSVPNGLAMAAQQGSIGHLLGPVLDIKKGSILFTSAEGLHVGDRLRLLPKSDHDGTGFIVKELFVKDRSVKAVAAGLLVRIPVPGDRGIQKGDAVFKVRGVQVFTMSEEACRRRLAGKGPQPAPIRIMIECTRDTMMVQGQGEGFCLAQQYPVHSVPAEKRPLSVAALDKVFSRTGETPFVLTTLTASDLPLIVIAPSRLNEVRRDFYQRLVQVMNEARKIHDEEQRSRAMAALLPLRADGNGMPRRHMEITIGVTDWSDTRILDDQRVARVLIPLTSKNIHALDQGKTRLAPGKQRRVVWDVPAVIFESEWSEYQGVIRRLTKQGFLAYRLNNLGHFPLFDGIAEKELSCGFRLPTLNSQAALAWQRLGAQEVLLSMEADRRNIGALLRRETGVIPTLVVYSSVSLMISRIPLRSIHGGRAVLFDQEKNAFRMNRQKGLTEVSANSAFSLLGRLDELRAIGACRIFADISHLGLGSGLGRGVLAALHNNDHVPETSTFNFDRGLK